MNERMIRPRRHPWLWVAVLGSAMAWAVPAAATDPSSWMIRYLSGYDLRPNPPVIQQHTVLVLNGWFPFDCGVVDAQVVDLGHVEITLRPGPACPDTTRGWRHEFDLGYLPTGDHEMSVRLTMEHPDSGTTVETGYFAFGVVDSTWGPPPPPPPPPPPVGELLPSVLRITFDPEVPSALVPTRVTLMGHFPYPCGQVTDARVVDPSHAELRLAPGPACSDTSVTWAHTFDLGLLTAGPHSLALRLTLARDGLPDSIESGTLAFEVTPDGQLPPPPPPRDSVDAALSPSRPNPFDQSTRFSVSLDQSVRAELGVYDLAGRRVRLVHAGSLPRGTTSFAWDGRNTDGSRARDGIYFYRLTLPDRVVTRRVVLLRR